MDLMIACGYGRASSQATANCMEKQPSTKFMLGLLAPSPDSVNLAVACSAPSCSGVELSSCATLYKM